MTINQSIFDSLQSIFSFAIATAFPDLLTPQAKLNPVADKMAKFGDYMCVSTMDIAKLYKEQGVNKNPREIAQKIVDSIPQNEIIESTNIAGPGFINVMINQAYLLKQISSIYQNDVQGEFSKVHFYSWIPLIGTPLKGKIFWKSKMKWIFTTILPL